MEEKDDSIHIEDDDAMAAVSNTGLRWVLIVGLLLAIGLLSLIWITGALTQGDVESEATVDGTQEAMVDEDDDTDSILIEDTQPDNEAELNDADDGIDETAEAVM